MIKKFLAGAQRALGDERFAPYRLDSFTDHTVQATYETVSTEFRMVETDAGKPSKPLQLLQEAKSYRGTPDRAHQIRAACIYLRHAQILSEPGSATQPQEPTAADAYHHAANELRQLDLLDRAAQCYFNSGVSAIQASRLAGSDRAAALRPWSWDSVRPAAPRLYSPRWATTKNPTVRTSCGRRYIAANCG